MKSKFTYIFMFGAAYKSEFWRSGNLAIWQSDDLANLAN